MESGAGHYFEILIRCHLVLNIVPFLVSTVELIGNFCHNRQSVVNRCPLFAYSFVSLMLRQYYWSCNSYSTNKQSAANNKKNTKFPYWHCKCAPLPLSAQRRCPFAFTCRAQRSTNSINTVYVLRHSYRIIYYSRTRQSIGQY